MNQLYTMGKEIVSNKKDKSKMDIEFENQEKECSFQPKTTKYKINSEEEAIANAMFSMTRFLTTVISYFLIDCKREESKLSFVKQYMIDMTFRLL